MNTQADHGPSRTNTDSTLMLIEQTRDRLRTLKLTGMLDALERQIEQPDTHDLSFEQRLGLLVEHESLHRENRRLARLLTVAKLRVPACIEDIDYTHPRGLDKSKLASLAQLAWIRSGMNLCVTGSTGCGWAPPARPGSPARSATRPAGSDCRPATTDYRDCWKHSGSVVATARTRDCSRSCRRAIY